MYIASDALKALVFVGFWLLGPAFSWLRGSEYSMCR
jgi:hypothetical protein